VRKSPKVAVCLLSSHPLVLAEWERLLASPGFELKAWRLESAPIPGVEKLPLPHAEVFVLDAHAPRQMTEMLVAEIQEHHPRARQIVVAEKLSEPYAFPLLRLGAKALLSYAESHAKLAQVVKVVAAGGFWVPRDLLSRFVESNLTSMRGRYGPPSPASLSPRERQVLDAVLENLANKEIADRLHISERTVKFHVSRVLGKFSVRRRSDLILHCYQDRSPGL